MRERTSQMRNRMTALGSRLCLVLPGGASMAWPRIHPGLSSELAPCCVSHCGRTRGYGRASLRGVTALLRPPATPAPTLCWTTMREPTYRASGHEHPESLTYRARCQPFSRLHPERRDTPDEWRPFAHLSPERLSPQRESQPSVRRSLGRREILRRLLPCVRLTPGRRARPLAPQPFGHRYLAQRDRLGEWEPCGRQHPARLASHRGSLPSGRQNQ